METEKERLSEINIVIATPGRLLSHMDQTSDFVYDNLQILVLDEADRCLDEGFERTLKAIISGLPKNRQTLLFSATQRKSLSALALLSLKNPEYISVVDQSDHHTPDQLVQKYTVCDDGEKLNILCSFIKSHKKMKILVFVSSCKQARFIYEVFCKLQPGIIISCLHGRQKQTKRLEVFSEFSRKSAICLISTDIASRGLDFPAVDWVFQLDCPEDTDTYIHRVGRTARYNSDGNSLLLLSKTEESGIVEKLRKQKVPIMKTSIKSSKLTNIAPSIQALCTQFPEIKYLAQRAIASYVRGVHLRRDKSTFNVSSISVASLAKSYGLESIPKIRILKSRSSVKNVSRDLENVYKLDDNESIRNGARDVSERGGALPLLNGLRKSRAKYEPTQSESTESSVGHNKEKDPSRDDGIIVLKRKHDEIDIPEAQEKVTMPVNHRKILKLRRREIKNRGTGRHVKFDLDGNATESLKFKSVQSFASEKTLDARRMEYIEKAAKFIEAEDKIDKETARALLREKRARKKLKRSEMV